MDNNVINFMFEWKGKDFDKISPDVLAVANKLLELNLVKVEPNLSEFGEIVITHRGVCRVKGLVECLKTSLTEEEEFYYIHTLKPDQTLSSICNGRDKEKSHMNCQFSSCPIQVAGYLYYLKHLDKSKLTEQEKNIENTIKNLDKNDIYNKNYELLKSLNLSEEIKEFLEPLAFPSIKTLRTVFLGEEGTDKEMAIKKIAEYLHKIGKIENNTPTPITLFTAKNLSDRQLYVLKDLYECQELLDNNDNFSSSADSDKKNLKKNLNKLLNQSQGKYIIINATPIEFKKFIKLNSKLPYIFDNVIYFKNYDDSRLLEIFEENLSEHHKSLINEETKKTVLSYLDKNKKYFPFKNADLSLFLAGYASRKKEIELPKERYNASTLDEMFENIIGMNNIKNQITELHNFLKFKNKLEKQNISLPNFNLHMLFLGNPGTGKTTIARLIAKTLFDLGYIKENKCIEVEAKDLIAAYTGQTFLKTSRVINSAIGGVLFIDEAYSLVKSGGDYGAEALATLIKAMEDSKEDLVVIFAGYSKEMQEFINANSGIQSRIGYTLEFADYTEEELYQIFELKANKIKFKIDNSAKEKIYELINYGKTKKNFGNGRYIDNILQKSLTKHSALTLKDSQLSTFTSASIPSVEEILTQSSGERKPEIVEKLFEDIVGLENVKKQVVELSKYIKFKDELSKISDTRLPDMRLHMLFTGDAGTGKTTMARKITEMLYNIGCIRINKLVEVERKDLVAEWVGQTAPKTEKVIEGALGGVLFIDEAYTLTPEDNSKDFGQEAIATLIKAMEDHRDELVVIFAGYTEEMKRFVNSNSGIASRIGYTFEFENYKPEELYKIFEIKCKKYNLIIKENVKEKVMELFRYFSSVENFGNGRFVDKILQETLINHSQNTNLSTNLNVLMTEDIPSIKEIIETTFSNRNNLVIPSDLDNETRRRIALHEMGHAIIHYIYKGETNLKVITIVPEGNGNLGYVLYTTPKTKVMWTKRDYLDQVEELLAGRAAEELFLGIENVSSGCSNDLEKASSILNKISKEYGMSKTLGLINSKGSAPNLEMSQKMDEEIKQILNSCYENVKYVLNTNREMFDNVLNSLMEKGTLTGEQFVELLKN